MSLKIISDMGDFVSNAYVVSDGESAVLIDAPCDPSRLLEALEGKKLEAILLTHGHIDHMYAAGELKKTTGCDVYISQEDAGMLESPELSLANYFSEPFERCSGAKLVHDGDKLTFCGMEFMVISTPGHTKGSVCYVCKSENAIFSGDTLFAGSIGRNFSGETYKKIIPSIERLYDLGANYNVYPGHGEKTDLRTELAYNPFLGELSERIKPDWSQK